MINPPGTEIIRCEVGSTLHGIGLEDQDDIDLMAVFVPPERDVTGLGDPSRTYTWRTQPEGVRSGPGDTDYVAHSLKKWMGLATKGNPSVLVMLWAPPEFTEYITPVGRELRDLAPSIVSRQAGARFAGYLHAQRERAEGTGKFKRGATEGAKSPDRLGKYASHVVRLGYQGVELCETGRLTLPMPPEQRDYIKAVKRGDIPVEEAMILAKELEGRLLAFGDGAPTALPREADFPTIEKWMHYAYRRIWREQR